MELYDKIKETAAFIKSQIDELPTVGIVLGSGLGIMADSIEMHKEIPYKDIPHFPVSTVQGHKGTLAFGKIKGKNTVMMKGRFHYYEGYDMETVTFPIRVMKELGVQALFISNAAGGMNKQFKVGDIMLIDDHINLFPDHPLRGPSDERLGIRFPDMSEPYSVDMLKMAQQAANNLGIKLHHGVYVGIQGPTFETRAEYRWLHIIGGDAVGMSTVPEVIVAIHSKMKVLAASVITDLGILDVAVEVSHAEVLEAANTAAPKLAAIFEAVIEKV